MIEQLQDYLDSLRREAKVAQDAVWQANRRGEYERRANQAGVHRGLTAAIHLLRLTLLSPENEALFPKPRSMVKSGESKAEPGAS